MSTNCLYARSIFTITKSAASDNTIRQTDNGILHPELYYANYLLAYTKAWLRGKGMKWRKYTTV